MNKSNKIRVKTPVGYTPWAKTDQNSAQGSGEAGIISSCNLDQGMQDVTPAGSDGLVSYVDLQVPHTIYMDDCNVLEEDIKSAQKRI